MRRPIILSLSITAPSRFSARLLYSLEDGLALEVREPSDAWSLCCRDWLGG